MTVRSTAPIKHKTLRRTAANHTRLTRLVLFTLAVIFVCFTTKTYASSQFDIIGPVGSGNVGFGLQHGPDGNLMPTLSGEPAVDDVKKSGTYNSLLEAMKPFFAADRLNQPAADIKLVASDGVQNGYFGYSVAISGDTLIVGAPKLPQGNGGTIPGAAYVFVRNGSSWTFQQKLSAPSTPVNNGNAFGQSVSISGNTVIVGAPQQNFLGERIGAAYVFVRTGTTWALQRTFEPEATPTFEDFSDFGRSVAISGETVLIGTHGILITGDDSEGIVHVFVRNDATWTRQATLTSGGTSPREQAGGFGYSAAISGDVAVIGDPTINDEAAYIFFRCGTEWTRQQKLIPSEGQADRRFFGSSVAISGGTVIIGAPDDNFAQGSAYMFVQNGTTWTQQQKVIASGADALSRFGKSVAILGDTAIIGRPRGEIATSWNRGSAYVFVRSGTSWIFNERLTASDGQNADAFGSSVAISSDSVIVGAPNVQTQSGAAYVRNRATTPVPPAPPPCETDITVNISTDLADADLEDDVCDVDAGMSGQQCSLRAAIQTANAKAGPDVILFDIPGGGTHTISPLSLLPPVTEKVSIDATTQPGYSASPLVELRGSGGNYGLAFATGSNDSLVSGFAINRFQAAIAFQSSGNRAEKCYIGLSPAGTAAGMADEQLIGIDIRSATANNNTIGGLGNLRNVISNNSIGVAISQSSTGNKILGNRIGTNTSGTSAIPNVVGVFIESANGNTIGDLITNTNGNLISGNSMLGVLLQTNASNNRVINNSIGTTAGGTGFLPNGEVGILLTAGAHDNRIEKNVIGGHNLTVSSSGIGFGFTAGPLNSVTDNFIGVGRDLATAIPNKNGIVIFADGQVIGAQNAGNIIGNNEKAGIWITSVSGGGTNPVVENNIVQYNKIGTNGTDDIGNTEYGVWVNGNSQRNTVTQNIVSGNNGFGIALTDAPDSSPDSNSIKLNFIGTNTSGTSAIPNGGGIWIRQATNNSVESNLVSGNSLGMLIGTNIGLGPTAPFVSKFNEDNSNKNAIPAYTSGNQIFGNVVGLNASRNAAIPGSSIGIAVGENARNNLIGSASGAYNLISGNTATIGYGILLGTLAANPAEDALPQLNTFQGNVIGLAGNLQSTISNTKGFVLLQAKLNTIGGNTDLLANTIVASTQEGISILDRTRDNTFLKNYLGVLPPGFGSRPQQKISGSPAESPNVGVYANGSHGILLSNGSQGNTLGGATTDSGLVIANNGGNGINLASTAGSGNRIGTNSIYGNTLRGIALGGGGFTLNDPADADVGPNNLQNYPTMTFAISSGNLIVNYQVDSAPANSVYGTSGLTIAFFKADAAGQGTTSLGNDLYLASDYANGTPGTRQKNLGNAAALGFVLGDRLTAIATDADGNSSEFTPISSPTAANADISGQVLRSDGSTIGKARLRLTSTNGEVRSTMSSGFGYYKFEDVPAGETYVLSISHKLHQFDPNQRILNVMDSITDLDFVASP